MAGRTQISVWIFCVCYRQMKACAVIGIQLLMLALELVALRCHIASTRADRNVVQSAVSLRANGGQLVGFVYIQRVYRTAVQVLQVDDTVLGKADWCRQVCADLGCCWLIVGGWSWRATAAAYNNVFARLLP